MGKERTQQSDHEREIANLREQLVKAEEDLNLDPRNHEANLAFMEQTTKKLNALLAAHPEQASAPTPTQSREEFQGPIESDTDKTRRLAAEYQQEDQNSARPGW